MQIVLMLLCVVGFSYTLSQSSGPFDIFSIIRNLLARAPFIGPSIFALLTCPFCLGWWVSAGVYCIANIGFWSLTDFVFFIFGGAAFNLTWSRMLEKWGSNS